MTLSARVSVLDIPSAMDTHSGNYTCTATNKAGSANHTAVLNVIGTTLADARDAYFLFSSSCRPTLLLRGGHEFRSSRDGAVFSYRGRPPASIAMAL